jgi:hypothetical protein
MRILPGMLWNVYLMMTRIACFTLVVQWEKNHEARSDRRKWKDDGARKQLVQFFEAWGPTDEAAVNGCRRFCFRNLRPDRPQCRGARLRRGRGGQFRPHCRAGRATMPMNAVYQSPGDLADVIPV